MSESEKRKAFHEEFAERILEGLKNGTSPFLRPWKAGEFQPPRNPVSGTVYKGANFLRLATTGFGDPRWMTLRQANEQGWRIKKGAKAARIAFWKFTRREPQRDAEGRPLFDEAGNAQTEEVRLDRPFVSIAHVFHATDVNGVPEWIQQAPAWNSNLRAETILANSGAQIRNDQLKDAFFRPDTDAIHLPPKGNFPDEGAYYATALHELGHWLCDPKRLNVAHARACFGSEDYARDELRVEIASWMLCLELGLPHNPDRHLSYVGAWIKALEKDSFEIVRACRDAEKIKERLLGMERARYVQEEQSIPQQETAVSRIKEEAKEKTWLNVSYSERHRAKALGARWDRAEKSWFAPAGSDLSAFAAWLGTAEKSLPALSPEAEFSERLREAGLDLRGEMPCMDGKIHRVPLQSRPNGRDGAYRGNLDGRPAGWFQNHVTGETGTWKYSGHKLDQAQMTQLREQAAQKRDEQSRILEEQHERVARRCYAVWKNTQWASPDQAYLQKKGVPGLGVKMDDHGHLLIAGRDADGRIRTLQTVVVGEKVTKLFERGSKKTGAFHVIDPKKQFGQGPILIAEGYATAASVHLALDQPVVCAFDAGNLVHVARALREKYPELPILFMADNDLKNPLNPGLNKAKLAADTVAGQVHVPLFTTQEAEQGLKDWNDLHQARGLNELRKQIDFSRPLYRGKLEQVEQKREAQKAEGLGLAM